jgi:hypothetical protein
MDAHEIRRALRNIESLLTALNISNVNMAARLDNMESRLDNVENRLNTVDTRLNTTDTRLNTMDTQVKTLTANVTSLQYKVNKIFDQIMDTTGTRAGGGGGDLAKWVDGTFGMELTGQHWALRGKRDIGNWEKQLQMENARRGRLFGCVSIKILPLDP